MSLFNKIYPHIGHLLEAVKYGKDDFTENVAIECYECREVVVDADYDEDDA